MGCDASKESAMDHWHVSDFSDASVRKLISASTRKIIQLMASALASWAS